MEGELATTKPLISTSDAAGLRYTVMEPPGRGTAVRFVARGATGSGSWEAVTSLPEASTMRVESLTGVLLTSAPTTCAVMDGGEPCGVTVTLTGVVPTGMTPWLETLETSTSTRAVCELAFTI